MTITETSPQEIFDTVVNHLRAQKVQSMFDGSCVYRTTDGLKCAIGGLLTDEEYSPKMEGALVDSLLELPIRLRGSVALMVDLQDVHDVWNISDWEVQLARVASNHSLTYTPPKG